MIDCVGMHLKAGSEKECVYIGGGCDSEFLSLLCGCSLHGVQSCIVSMIKHLDCHCELRMSVYKGVM